MKILFALALFVWPFCSAPKSATFTIRFGDQTRTLTIIPVAGAAYSFDCTSNPCKVTRTK
jgi:hypothetical protein